MKEYYCKVNETPNRNQSCFPDNAVSGFEAGVYAGRQEVVNWVKDRLRRYKVAPKLLGFTMLSEEWFDQLKEWGISV